MSNYIEYGDKVAFHPGYYIKEIVDESGLTQEEFAMRLNTTPKTLSKIINGQQSLSPAIALKLSRMLGTSAEYWLNLQNKYDVVAAECEAEKDACTERKVFDCLNYKYFIENFQLPELKRDVQGQIKALREFLNVSTLTVLKNKDLTVSFRSEDQLSESNIIKANIMVQMAVNIALKTGSPKYDKIKFSDAIEYALTLTRDHERFYSSIRNEFNRCGVILVVLPNLPGSKTNGATRKIGNRVLLMINDRRTYADTFWFTLFHEIGHIMYDEFGISLENEKGNAEEKADHYAEDKLIPPEKYSDFTKERDFSSRAVLSFADEINRDPGIIVGRLMKDKLIDYRNNELNNFRRQYRVIVNQ